MSLSKVPGVHSTKPLALKKLLSTVCGRMRTSDVPLTKAKVAGLVMSTPGRSAGKRVVKSYWKLAVFAASSVTVVCTGLLNAELA